MSVSLLFQVLLELLVFAQIREKELIFFVCNGKRANMTGEHTGSLCQLEALSCIKTKFAVFYIVFTCLKYPKLIVTYFSQCMKICTVKYGNRIGLNLNM